MDALMPSALYDQLFPDADPFATEGAAVRAMLQTLAGWQTQHAPGSAAWSGYAQVRDALLRLHPLIEEGARG
jgi:hypothetical protein